MADDEFEPDDVGEDFDEVEDDADIDEIDQQEEDGENIELINAQDVRGGVQKSNRITTKYMTKSYNGREEITNNNGCLLSLKEDFCDVQTNLPAKPRTVEINYVSRIDHLPTNRISLLPNLSTSEWMRHTTEELRRKRELLPKLTKPINLVSQSDDSDSDCQIIGSYSPVRNHSKSEIDSVHSKPLMLSRGNVIENFPLIRPSISNPDCSKLEPLVNNLDLKGVRHKTVIQQRSLERFHAEPTMCPNMDIISYVDSIFNEKLVEKNRLLTRIQRIDAEIFKTSELLDKRRDEAKLLEEIASHKQAKNKEGDELNGHQPLHMSLAEKIYFENKKKAHTSKMLIARFDASGESPLYKEPSDTAVYHENKAKFVWFKERLVRHLRTQKRQKEAMTRISNQKRSELMEKWQKDLKKLEECEERLASNAAYRAIFEKEFPHDKDDIKEKSNEDKYLGQAEIPPLRMDAGPRQYSYINNNGRVYDFNADHNSYKISNTWTTEEKEIFKKKYVEHPKNFAIIASFLKDKSGCDCVQYYYHNKKQENFKLLVRKSRKNKSFQNSTMLAEDLILNNASGVTTRKQWEQIQKEKQLSENKRTTRRRQI